MYRHRCRRCLGGYVDGVGGGCCYGVSLRWCDCGIAFFGAWGLPPGEHITKAA